MILDPGVRPGSESSGGPALRRLAGMQVTLNGRSREVPDPCTVEELILAADLDPRFVIVEHNGEPLERKRYGNVAVAAGDRLELVRAVAGG